MVDRLVDRVLHVLAEAVAQLDPRQLLDRDPAQLIRLDAELRHVPRVDRDPTLRAVHHFERRVDASHVDVEGHELVDDCRIRALCRLVAQLPEALVQLRQLGRNAGDVPDLDVVRVQRRRRLEQQRTHPVGGDTPLVARIEEPVHQELELEVTQPVVVEGLLQLPQRPRLEQVLEVGVPDAEPANPTSRAAAHRSAQSKRLHSRP